MSVIFYKGEQPSDPLIVTVRDDAGNPVSLSDVSSVEFTGDPLPAGTAGINNASQGKVQYTFSAPFTAASDLTLQIKMTDDVAGIDYSAPFVIRVLDPADTSPTLVTPPQVEVTTGSSVTQSQVVRAQGLVSLVVGRDLSDADWYAGLSQSDQFWLKTGISYQAASMADQDRSSIVVPYAPGVSTLRTGDQTVTYSAGGGSVGELASLASSARLALKRLSWMSGSRTVHALPFLGEARCEPVLWYEVAAWAY
jgi:hypothetical protein